MSGRLRTTALLAAGAFGVHQLRYAVAHGDAAGEVLAREGHSYLSALAPPLAVLVGVALLDFLLAVARRRSGGHPARRARWLAVTLTLVAIYAVQESLEGVLAAGHPAGVAAVLGNGGWVALPIAAAIGLVIALLLRGAERAIAALARSRPLSRARRARADLRQPADAPAPRQSPLAVKLAGRAPPAFPCQ